EGGYFISLDAMPGCAKKIVALALEAGVKLTAAGACFPYGQDPQDSNIRIAPSFPSLADIESAMDVLAVCIKLACVRKLLA
ncbi:MAG TPA: aminotransferase, partial [Gammaproteobacteria bacterium]|nr:aminotransferase [Gammaproteobacteria bacterium]